jgi:hypothetical protein
MLTMFVIAAVALGLGVLYGHSAGKFTLFHRRTQELHERLAKLEDRFYHPVNYDQAFFRPTGKRKDNDSPE